MCLRFWLFGLRCRPILVGLVLDLGGGGMVVWVWFASSAIIGCVCQVGEFFVRYIVFLIRW